MYKYKLTDVRVIDGDTLRCNIQLGFEITLVNKTIRLNGIDTGEIHSRDLIEKQYGLLAKNYVIELCKDKELILTSDGYDKFGRILGTIELPDGDTIGSKLINNYLAVSYTGKCSKETIKEKHLKNIELLGI